MDFETRVDGKLDKIIDHIGSIDTTIALQQASLDEHIRRTNLLEQKIIPIETKFTQYEMMLRGIFKLGAWCVGLLSVAAAIAEIIGFIRHA